MNTCYTLYISVLLITMTFTVTAHVNVQLHQHDFVNGTFRILESGEYHIREDINFGPRPDNDYWNDPRDRYYPIANFYMGFFAAITIEVDDVELYFHGHTIQQTEKFYLLQRFFNTIQLNDKVFVNNEGVGALNYQNRDNVTMDGHTQTVGNLVTVKNIRIQGGTIGRSSHIGIHGNGAQRVTIKDMIIENFEVAGIQCNGCKRVVIDRCTVGPSSREVPALATFSNARFMDLFINRMIPMGFARDGDFSPALLALLDEEIQFADRDEPVTIKQTFTRLEDALNLYTKFRANTLPAQLSEEEEELLEEAKKVFANPSGLPDGGVVYGIVINKLGVPHPDDNFFGSGYESGNIIIQNTEIKGLHGRPTQVPALQTVGGDFIQGTSRDVFRIFDLVSDRFRTLTDATYSGNFLGDVYLSMWKLSNSFYNTRIYDSECGNFGTNATMPYDILPGHADQCANGINRDPTLSGRMVTLFNKRYFGGLVLSQGVYDWATTRGMSIDKILASPMDAPSKRAQTHYITCGADTMFHNMQGMIGLKILETNRVVLKNMKIHNIVNKADAKHWVCEQKWKLPSTGETIKANHHGGAEMQGPDIKGVQILFSDKIKFSQVDISNLKSEEGNVFGIQVMDDTNDRTDYENGPGLTFEYSTISKLTSGGKSKAFDLSGAMLSPSSGLTIGPHEELHNGFLNPKTSITYGFSGSIIPDAFDAPGSYPVENIHELVNEVSTFSTPEELAAFRNKGIKYFETYYGLKFSDFEATGLAEPITVYHQDGSVSDSSISWFAYDNQMKYHGLSFCSEDSCSDVLKNSLLIDIGFLIFVGGEGLELHGTFGGDEGQFAPLGTFIFSGFYAFENVEVNGKVHNNVEIEYYPVCPITATRFESPGQTLQSILINCELESSLFGKGLATGALNYVKINETNWEANGYSVMVFDDIVDFPIESGVSTHLGDNVFYDEPKALFSVWADGNLGNNDMSFQLFPLVKNYHFTDESATRYFKEQTSYNSDEKIAVLRKRFLTRLRDDFGVTGINPDGFDDIPVDAKVDLGGGTSVQAYEVSDNANLRILSKIDSVADTAETLPKGSRVREVGFRIVFGRAGRGTKYGHLPQGTMLSEGVYIMENTEFEGSRLEVSFFSNFPVVSDWWSSGVISNTVECPEYGTGAALLAVTAPMMSSAGGKHVNIRGTIKFD